MAFRNRGLARMWRARPANGRGLAAAVVLAGALVAAGRAEADLADLIAQEVEASLNGMSGTEIQGGTSGSVMGVNLSLDLLGFALCLPPSPGAPPVATPVPPANAYGCVNAAQVNVSLHPDFSGGELTVAVGTLYVDAQTQRDRTYYCGEFGSGTVTRQGWFLGSCVSQAPFTLVTSAGCRRVELGYVVTDITAIEPHLDDNCLNTWADLMTITLSLFEPAFQDYFQQVLQAAVDGANPGICAQTQGADVPEAAARARLLPWRPNPFNPRTTLRFELPAPGAARLVVHDLAGRLVRTLVDADLSAGAHEAVWDGRDAQGRDVASGTYQAGLEYAGRVEITRLTLVR